jgi:hypothetical protein
VEHVGAEEAPQLGVDLEHVALETLQLFDPEQGDQLSFSSSCQKCFCQNHTTLFPVEISSTKFGLLPSFSKNCPKVNNLLIGEISPNLVPLILRIILFIFVRNFAKEMANNTFVWCETS